MLEARTKNSFEFTGLDLPKILAVLREAGLKELPGWRLSWQEHRIWITPNTDTKRLRFTVTATEHTWDTFDAILASHTTWDADRADTAVQQLIAAGFAPRPFFCFSGQRASVQISLFETEAGSRGSLEIKGFAQQPIHDLLKPLGIDTSILDRRPSRFAPSRPAPPAPLEQVRLRATLLGSDPLIWRVFTVPTTATLWVLHCALTDLFGWNDGHLHQFTVPLVVERDGHTFLAALPWGIPDDEGTCLPDWRVTLADLIARKSPAFVKPSPVSSADLVTVPVAWRYVYNFRRFWSIKLQVEAIEPATDRLVHCLEGDGASPPDNFGGVARWNEYIAQYAAESSESSDGQGRTGSEAEDAPAEAPEPWQASKVRFSSATRRLSELRWKRDELADDQPRQSLDRRIADFLSTSMRFVEPLVTQTIHELVYWLGTVLEGKLVLIGTQDEKGGSEPRSWYWRFELSAQQMVAEHPEEFVDEDVPFHPIELPMQRQLSASGKETLRFTMLVVVPPEHRRVPHEEAVTPVAALTKTPRLRAMEQALRLAHQPTTNDLVTAGRRLLLASFDPTIRATLGLSDTDVGVPLSAIE